MMIKIKQLEEFLKEGYKVKVEMFCGEESGQTKSSREKGFYFFWAKLHHGT